MIMKETRDGRELVEYALATFRDENRMHHVRWEAMVWLANRGLGLPVATVELEAAIAAPEQPPKLDLTKLNDKQRGALRDILLRMLNRPRDAAPLSTGGMLRVIDGDVQAESGEEDE